MSGTDTALFERVVGPRFTDLPDAVRSLHRVDDLILCEGRCRVERGRGVLARLVASLFSLPSECTDRRIQVTKRREGDREWWIRTIGSTRFASTIRASGTRRIVEKIGVVEIQFGIEADATGLDWQMLGARAFGIPLPRWLRPRMAARESDDRGQFHFEVSAAMPGIGLVVAYSGTLQAVVARAGEVPGQPVMLFDGVCNFCNRGVDFFLGRDPHGRIRFAAMQSEPGRALLQRHGLPDSEYETFVVLDGDKVLGKSDSFLHLIGYLPWPWPLVRVFAVIPRPFRDWAYDLVARNRYKLMGKRTECRMPDGRERERFLV